MLGLSETIDHLTMANSVPWYVCVLRRTLDFEVEGQKMEREAEEDVDEVGCGGKCEGWFEKGRWLWKKV